MSRSDDCPPQSTEEDVALANTCTVWFEGILLVDSQRVKFVGLRFDILSVFSGISWHCWQLCHNNYSQFKENEEFIQSTSCGSLSP